MTALEERFLSTEEVAERLQVDEQTVRRWIKSGKLEAVKPGREWRIPPGAFEALLESYRSPKGPAPLQLELEKQRGAGELSANDLATLCGEIYAELQGIRETPAEALKTQAIADLAAELKEAQEALSTAINRKGPPRLSELSMQRVIRQRRLRQSDEDSSETA